MSVGLRPQVQSTPINFAASGDNTLIAAVAGKLITVVGLFLVVAGATNLTFKDGTGGTALTGTIPMLANGAMTLDEKPEFDYFQTSNVANNFVLNSSVAVQVSGRIYFVQW